MINLPLKLMPTEELLAWRRPCPRLLVPSESPSAVRLAPNHHPDQAYPGAMPDEEELESAARQRYERVVETLRERIGVPLARLSGTDELAELTNLLGVIQTGNPGESLPVIRTVRAWLKLKEHEAVDVARAEGIPWRPIADELGVHVDTVFHTHHNTFDPADTRDT
jgi:hypothetical protein